MRSFLVFAAAAPSVLAHTIFQQLYVNGVSPGHLKAIRYPTYDGPITDVTSTDTICNGGPDPLVTPFDTTIVNVTAGASFTAEWHHTLNSTPSTDSQDPIDPSHLGPIMTYLAQVPSALQTNVTGLQWFKIWHDGLDGSTWATTKMISNAGKVTFTIPSCIPSGNYLLRHELIALHAASSYPGAQMYMECAQINIVNGGSASPQTYSIPGIYTPAEVTTDIYYPPITNYAIPGPPVFSCPGSSGAAPPSSPASSAPSQASTPIAPASSAPSQASTPVPPATSSVPPSTATAPKYGQCGGTGWTGATVCAAGSTCTYSSAYYSQCL